MDVLFLNDIGLDSDLMCKIMTYVDAKSVFGMRLVSKNWHGSVYDPKFIKHHNKHCQVKDQQRHIMICEIDTPGNPFRMFISVSCLMSDKEPWRKIIPHPKCRDNHMMDIVGIIDGILCLAVGSLKYCITFVLSNPTTGQHLTIKPPWKTVNNSIVH